VVTRESLEAAAGRDLEIDPTVAENGSKTEKDTKIEGTNSTIC
jgi:hypothetical protein